MILEGRAGPLNAAGGQPYSHYWAGRDTARLAPLVVPTFARWSNGVFRLGIRPMCDSLGLRPIGDGRRPISHCQADTAPDCFAKPQDKSWLSQPWDTTHARFLCGIRPHVRWIPPLTKVRSYRISPSSRGTGFCPWGRGLGSYAVGRAHQQRIEWRRPPIQQVTVQWDTAQ